MNKVLVGVRKLLGRYLEGLRRYADFGGATELVDYLSFFVVNLAIGLSLRGLESTSDDGFFELVGLLYGFFVLIPGLAITVRLVRFLSPRPPQRGGS